MKMVQKLKVDKIVEKMKEAIKEVKKEKKPFNPVIKIGPQERDMRQEAMDMGSHGAKDIFGASEQ